MAAGHKMIDNVNYIYVWIVARYYRDKIGVFVV